MRSVRYLTVYYGVSDGAKGNASAQVVQKESDHRYVETDINYKTHRETINHLRSDSVSSFTRG